MNSTMSWFGGCDPSRPAALRLFCFPFAGGSAQVFRDWKNAFGEEVEVCPIQLPGRQQRFREPPLRTVPAIAEAVSAVLAPLTDRPYALFGHSMGSAVAFEVARRLRALGAPPPAVLMVSGRGAPHRPRSRPPIHDLPQAAFIDALRRYGGTPEEVFQHPELLDLMIPLLRADFEAVETYRPGEEPPLDCPILAFGGIDDPDVGEEDVAAWARHGAAGFAMHRLPGGHFFLNTHASDLLPLIRAALDRLRSKA